MAERAQMEANLERLRPFFDPTASEFGGHVDPKALLDLFADDITVTFQGRNWPLGGTFVGKEGLMAFLGAIKVCYQPVHFKKALFALGEDHIALEWFSEVTNWKGESAENRGSTIFEYRGDQIVAWREYTDTEFKSEFLAGWQDVVDPDIGRQLPNWKAS